jgi:Flp pilus assembly pilin Flp
VTYRLVSLDRRRQTGAAAVEFAIVSGLFFVVLLGAIEMGRLLWTWNAAAEATRLGARMAVVCDINDPDIKLQMQGRLPALTAGNIQLQYFPAGCTALTCQSVSVALTGYTHQPIIPLGLIGGTALSIPIPPFQTTLPKEWMNSTGNPVCN